MWPERLPQTFAAVAVLIGVALVALAIVRVRLRFAPALAIVRAGVQLAIVSVLLTGIITSPGWMIAALLIMIVAASVTTARRVGFTVRRLAAAAGATAASASLVLVVVFAAGVIPFEPRYLLAVGGIVVGNCMSIAAMAGQRLSESVDARWDEVEAWLSLGATPRQSVLELVRRAVAAALTPTIDQTATTGLVALPGAFVGAIFAGASPLEAGRFQLVVLACVLAAGSMCAVLFLRWDAAHVFKPVPR